MCCDDSARFSALQRAENSSIDNLALGCLIDVVFQCSSASRKFLNCPPTRVRVGLLRVSVLFSEPKIPQSGSVKSYCLRKRGFSALQRAENSSIPHQRGFNEHPRQCFSALQRAENSSIRGVQTTFYRTSDVSVLFSEPKIPQFGDCGRGRFRLQRVSVLFSEPKIPQFVA